MTHSASSIGTFARDILAGGGEATVIAVFERSFYLLCDKGIVAVCDPSLGQGPLNVLVAASRPWSGVVRVDQKATVAATAIAMAGGPLIALANALLWSPPSFADWEAARVGTGVAMALDLARQALRGPRAGDLAMGLAPMLLGDEPNTARNPLLAGAEQLLVPLIDALPKAIAARRWPKEALSSATFLVGLGPGLTPSGDDVLGGLMLALAARGELRLRDQLWDQIVDDLDTLTVPPSAMHLTAAAHGMGHEAMHELLNSILAGGGQDLASKVDAVLAIGATSGIDAVAGALVGLAA